MELFGKVTIVVLISVAACDQSAVFNEHEYDLHKTALPYDFSKPNNANGLGDAFSPSKVVPESFNSLHTKQGLSQPLRAKRAIIFRPLFVYRQQQIKKQRLKEMRLQQRQHQTDINAQRLVTQKPKYAYRYPYYYNYMG